MHRTIIVPASIERAAGAVATRTARSEPFHVYATRGAAGGIAYSLEPPVDPTVVYGQSSYCDEAAYRALCDGNAGFDALLFAITACDEAADDLERHA
ncbi:hypothetical protein EPN52_00885 [bacterium]|nr:MAG: hypothetical protein EPN52_00885 [bacterium]